MKSAEPGRSTLSAEVTRVGDSDLSVLVDGEELRLAFDQFPWFQHAPAAAIRNVQRPARDRLRWPDLDIDLAIESLRHPERFPLVSKGS